VQPREQHAAGASVEPGDLLAANSLRGVTASIGQVGGPLAASVPEPLYARHVLDRPPSQFALFEAVIGSGAIVTVGGTVFSTVAATNPATTRPREHARPGLAGIRPGALILAAVAVAAGTACLREL